MDILPLGEDVSSPPAQRALAAAAATTEDKDEERCAASALKSSPLSPSLTCCSSLGSSRKQQHKRRLDFSQVFCGGHQAEQLKQLLEYYEGVQRSPHPQAMAVIVESHSGMGKTVLIDRFRASILLPAQQNDDDSRRKKQPLVCRGKFEERTAASEPFSAIAEAMKELCDQIVASSSSRNSTSIGSSSGEGEDDLLLWQKRIHDGLGDEIIFLQEIFPKMERLLQNSNLANSSSLTSTTLAASAGKKSILSSSPKSFRRELKPRHSSSSCSSTLPLDFEGFGNLTEKEWRFERFRLAFRSLIRIVSTLHGAPLVLLLDDLHWADPDSVALLHTLLEDSQRHRQFMLVAATRPNMDPAAVLMQPDNSRIVNDAVRHEPLRGSTQIRLMQLRNLRPHDVTCFLLHLLERAPHSQESSEQQSPLSSLPPHERDYTEEDFRSNPDVVSLAQLIFDKTYGNSFAVLQLLRLLEQEQLVYYSPEMSQWTWDIDELMQHESTNCLGMQSHTTAAGNHVVDDHNASVVTQIVVKSLQRAPEQQRRAVVIASVFGVSHFEVTTIVHAMKFLEKDCNISSSQGESETCAESRKETAGCMKFVGHGDDRNNVDMGNVYGDASSTFLDENSDDYDEDSLDPYQVNARVRIMHKILEDAARNGFVTETAPGQYKFTHDRIREAAYSLLPPDGSHAKQLLHLRIGRQLRSWMDQFGELGTTSRTALTSSSSSVAFFTSEESLLLHATKQLNLGAKLMTDTWEKLDLAEQNFLAAELAAKKTSFSPAMEYLEQGLKHLGDAPWKEHYTLTHKLNVALARIQYSCGRFHDSVETADEILSHGKTFRDKQPVYHTKLLCLQQVHQVQAQEFVLDILDELGHKFPRRFLMLHLLYGMRKVSGLLKGMSDDDILHIPKVQPRDDEHLHDCAEFLNRLVEISFMGGDTLYFPLFAIKILELTLELGLFILSPSAFLSWGIIQGRAGKLQDAVRFGRLSLTMAQSSHGRQHFARVRLAYYGSVFFWRWPLRDGIVPVREALQQYWKFGALDYVYLDVCILNRLIFACGEPLAAIALEFEKTAEFLLDYRQQVQFNLNAPIFQAVLNFIGDRSGVDDKQSNLNPAILSGKYIRNQDGEVDGREHQFAEWTTTKNNLALFQYQFYSVMVALWFGDLERAKTFLSEMQPVFEVSTDAQLLFHMFYSGLVYIALCKRSISQKQGRGHRRKYKKMAMAQHAQLVKWANDGAMTCVHMHLLLYAEKRSATLMLSSSPSANDVQQVRQEYDRAIESAVAIGLCHHEALANELAGVFLLSLQNNDEARAKAASVYLFRAVHLYHTWGAAAKVNDLYSRYSKALLAQGETSDTARFKETSP